MSRRHSAERREVNPDPKFNDLVISKFMNSIMREGKKSAAESIVYGALDKMQARAKSDPIQLFHQALSSFGGYFGACSPSFRAVATSARRSRSAAANSSSNRSITK